MFANLPASSTSLSDRSKPISIHLSRGAREMFQKLPLAKSSWWVFQTTFLSGSHAGRHSRHQTQLAPFDFLTLFIVSLLAFFQRPFSSSDLPLSHNLFQSELFQKSSRIPRILGMDLPWNQPHQDAFIPFSVPISSQLAQPEPQSQLYAMSPPARKQNEARKSTAKDLDSHRPEITRLYEDSTLPTTREFMREKYGLNAT